MKRIGCLYFNVITLMGSCVTAAHRRNAFCSPTSHPSFFEEGEGVEGGRRSGYHGYLKFHVYIVRGKLKPHYLVPT